ncbi:MAG: diphthamide biosynthesis enzyme Dph2 [Desulfurococcales archaeon]|nr:diphthamide biosynthesis enzyme Dph2 [Desulfurococcales archaeon]
MKCSERLEGVPYEFGLERVIEEVRRLSAKRIVLQLPDGLKQYSHYIYDCLVESLGEVEVYIHGDHNYGGCDLQYGQLVFSIRPDVILHIGHTPYPGSLSNELVEPPRVAGVRVIYVPAQSKLEITNELLEDLSTLLQEKGISRVGISTTSQHVGQASKVSNFLALRGFEVAPPKSAPPYLSDYQSLGCDYRLQRGLKVDAFVYVGGGVFHPLGLYLATLKPVIKIDPYESRVTDLSAEGEKLYKSRLFKVSQAFEAKTWAIVVGIKTGQYRPWLVASLKKEIEARGLKYYMIASENLDRDSLASIDSPQIDAFVVTSCPRLPTDDYWNYHKPVLTPGEAFMALRKTLQPYRFPW